MSAPLFTRVDRTVERLTGDVVEGRIGLPDLQRPFVWDDKDVRELLDSMMQGFPIGYCILWEAPDDQEDKKSVIGTNAKAMAPKELVIDGQQRLTSLISVMYGIPVKDKNFTDRVIRIAYNPITKDFHTWDAAIEKNVSYISDISTVFIAKRENKLPMLRGEYVSAVNEARVKRGEEPLTVEEEGQIESNLNELLDLETAYVIPTLSISNRADEEQVSDIFVRVNSGGQKLNEDDFIMTLISVYEPDMRTKIERFCEESHKPAQGTSYNPLLVVKASHIIRATVGLGFRRGRLRYARLILRGRDLKTRETSEVRRRENFEVFGDALDKVLNLNDWHAFINDLSYAGYVRSDLISSENAIPFTYTLYLIGKHRFGLDAIELRRIIKRWFFMATITGLYTGSFESVFEQELTLIDEMSEKQQFLDYLEGEIAARLTDDFFRVTLPNEFDKNKATGNIWNAFVASQIVLGAKTMFDTTPMSQLFSMGADGTKKAFDRHHIFPKNHLEGIGLGSLKDRRANFVCLDYSNNIDISDDPPSDYVPGFRKQLGEDAYAESCKQNALPLNFEEMEYEDFLEKRRRLMADLVKEAFETL